MIRSLRTPLANKQSRSVVMSNRAGELGEEAKVPRRRKARGKKNNDDEGEGEGEEERKGRAGREQKKAEREGKEERGKKGKDEEGETREKDSRPQSARLSIETADSEPVPVYPDGRRESFESLVARSRARTAVATAADRGAFPADRQPSVPPIDWSGVSFPPPLDEEEANDARPPPPATQFPPPPRKKRATAQDVELIQQQLSGLRLAPRALTRLPSAFRKLSIETWMDILDRV